MQRYGEHAPATRAVRASLQAITQLRQRSLLPVGTHLLAEPVKYVTVTAPFVSVVNVVNSMLAATSEALSPASLETELVRTPSMVHMANVSLEHLHYLRVTLHAPSGPAGIPTASGSNSGVRRRHYQPANDVLHATNPSLLLLPRAMRGKLGGGATYAVALRVSNHHSCGRPRQAVPDPCITLVGIKLLGAALQPLVGREALLQWDGLSICTRTPYEDCRLSAHADGNTLLLVCKTLVSRLSLAVDNAALDTALPMRDRFDCELPLLCPSPSRPPSSRRRTLDECLDAPMRHVIRGGLRVTLLGKPTFLHLRGKNFNLFTAQRDGGDGSAGGIGSHGAGGDGGFGLFVEEWVLGPGTPVNLSAPMSGPAPPPPGRRLHQVFAFGAATSNRGGAPATPGGRAPPVGYTTTESAKVLGPGYPHRPSFGPKMPAVAHGGGCCLHLARARPRGSVRTAGAKGEAGPRRWLALRHPSSHTAEDAEGEVASLARHAEIMLGVLHYKLEGYNYLQQLYAFQPRAPFEIIALSRCPAIASRPPRARTPPAPRSHPARPHRMPTPHSLTPHSAARVGHSAGRIRRRVERGCSGALVRMHAPTSR